MHRRAACVAAWVAACLVGPAPAAAQVDWSGDNVPEDGSVVETSLAAVHFEYAVFDPGRTEPPGRGTGLGAVLYFRDADVPGGAFTAVPMTYAGQTGPFGPNNDLFTADVDRAAFGGAVRVEYLTVVYDSTANPVHADTTRQDAAGTPPPFVFSFGRAFMPHDVYFHFSLCLNGEPALAPPVVEVDPQNGDPPSSFSMFQVSSDQIPDLWEIDLWLLAGTARHFTYRYLKDGQQERGGDNQPLDRSWTLDVGPFVQGLTTDSWRDAPLGCHLAETLAADVKVHFSVCLAGVAFAGDVCVIGNVPELGSWRQGVTLANLQPGTNSDLFEGDVVFPAGGPAVVQYKFQKDDCTTFENLWPNNLNSVTNRFLYIDGTADPYIAPTRVWGNGLVNLCGPPVGVESLTWSRAKRLYR